MKYNNNIHSLEKHSGQDNAAQNAPAPTRPPRRRGGAEIAQGPHSWAAQRFGGQRRRCRAHYRSDDETDAEMLLRHFAGDETNATLAGLRRLKIAAKSALAQHGHYKIL